MSGGGVRERVRASLREAMRAKDTVAMSALRSALAAIDNAEAVPLEALQGPATASHPRLAGTAVGVGAAEVARRGLGEDDQLRIVEREVGDRLSAAAELDAAGRPDRAERLRAEAAALGALLEG